MRTFPVIGPTTLVITTYRGSINVAEADTESSEIRVAVHLEIGGRTETEADAILKTLELNFEAKGGTVTVTAKRPTGARMQFTWSERQQIEPTYRVTVPRTSRLKLNTTTGAVNVGNIVGDIHVENEKGDIFLRHVTGAVEAITETGDVVISRCDGTLTAKTGHGLIRIGTVTGRCEVRNGSGDVELLGPLGEVRVYAEAGTVTLGIPKHFSGPAEVQTSGGSIVLSAHVEAKCRIDASTSMFAQVVSRLPMEIESGAPRRRSLVGRLNGGGIPVILRASGGNILLQRGEPRFD